jgi:hypothetical protein
MMCKAFDWKHSKISMLSRSRTPELYSISQDWFEYCFIYRLVACGEFGLCPSNQYILVRVILSCFCFEKICFCVSSVKVQAEILGIFFLGELYTDWGSTYLFVQCV